MKKHCKAATSNIVFLDRSFVIHQKPTRVPNEKNAVVYKLPLNFLRSVVLTLQLTSTST